MGPSVRWLESCRVLDLTDGIGSLCGKVLADFGADVIKIENPGGAIERKPGPFYKDTPHAEKSLYWFAFNTGKKGITLNIDTADGREILLRLVQRANILIESFTPGYMDKLSLGYPALREINSKLVYTTINWFGNHGPHSRYQACDLVIMALSGLLYVNGYPDRPPLCFSVDQVCCHVGLQAAVGSLLAYYYARQTGQGQQVDCSAQESLVISLLDVIPFWDLNRLSVSRQGDKIMRAKITQQDVFQCKDGQVAWRFFTGARGNWTRALVEWMQENGMAEGLGEVEWEAISFDDVTQEQASRWENVFESFFLTKTKAELQNQGARRGILIYPVNDIADIYASEQLKARDFWLTITHEELRDNLRYPGLPLLSSEHASENTRCAPHIGEHNLEVYCGELGLTRENLIALEQAGIV